MSPKEKREEIVSIKLNFDDDMKLSLNKVWSGWPWTQWVRKKASDLWHEDIWYYLEDNKIKPIKEKVDIYFKFYFSTWDSWWKRQLDSSNCSAMAKMIEDWLRYHKDKNPKWILKDDTNDKVWWFCIHSVEMWLWERRSLDASYVEVSIRKHSINI